MMLLLLLLTLNPASNYALAPPPSAFLIKSPKSNKQWTPSSLLMARTTGKTGSAISRVVNSRSNDGCINDNILMMVRGGGDDTDDDESSDDSDGESYESDLSDDETEVDEAVEESSDDDETEVGEAVESSDDDEEANTSENDEEINQPSPMELEKAQKSTQLASQSRNFAIATALWGSLFFDSILNKAKRLDLFPTSGAATAASAASLSATIVPTALLASGFALASLVSFLLWRDMEIGAEMMSSDDGTSSKGDWFLSLSTANDDGEDSELSQKFSSQTRAGLCLHLSLFGLLCLGAHAGYYFSNQATFLGMTAVIINVHNTLASVSALMKEEGAKDLVVKSLTWPLRLFQSKEKGGTTNGLQLSSFLFRLSAIAASVRCIQSCKYLVSLGSNLLSGGAGATESIILNNSRQLCLQIASLARLTLVAGVSQTLYASTVAHKKIRSHPFFNALSGGLGLGCLGVGGAMLFDASKSLTSANALSEIVIGGALMVLFGLFAGYNSVLGFSASMKKHAKS